MNVSGFMGSYKLKKKTKDEAKVNRDELNDELSSYILVV